MVIFGPMRQVGCLSACSDRDVAHLLQRHRAEWPARRRDEQAAHLAACARRAGTARSRYARYPPAGSSTPWRCAPRRSPDGPPSPASLCWPARSSCPRESPRAWLARRPGRRSPRRPSPRRDGSRRWLAPSRRAAQPGSSCVELRAARAGSSPVQTTSCGANSRACSASSATLPRAASATTAEALRVGAHDIERLPANRAGAAEDGDASALALHSVTKSSPVRLLIGVVRARKAPMRARSAVGFHVAFVASGVLADCTTASPALPVT